MTNPTPAGPLDPPPPGQRVTPAFEHLRVLWKRRWVILLIAGLGCLAAYGWTSKQARIYQADCTVQYDPNPPRPLGDTVTDVANPIGSYWDTREFFATQNKIIASRGIAEQVVRKLSLDQNAEFWGVPADKRAQWKGEPVEQTAKMLQGLISVTPERDTRLVHVLVKDTDPKRAKLLANTIVDTYIAKTMEDRLSATTGALDWLGKHLDTLKTDLESSELALHDFTEHHSNLAVSLEDQQNIVSDNIRQISEQLTQAKAKRIELTARVNELKAADSDDPMDVNASSVLANLGVQQLRQRFRELATEREGLIVTYGEKHPKILGIDSQLGIVHKQIRTEVDALIRSAEADLHETEQIEKGLQGALNDANRVGLELNLQDITYRRLERERDNTAKLYGTLLERTAQTDLTRALSVSFVRVVDEALAPYAPVSPRMYLNLAVGVLLGLMLGVGLASLLDQIDRTIHTIEDAEALGVTILGVMPSIEEGSPVAIPGYGRRKRRGANGEPLGNRDLIVHTHPQSTAAECCRTIRTNLTFMSAEAPRKTLVITSANPREGKTTVSLSLAISLAQSGKRVLLVDTDLRKPRLHRSFGKSGLRGVTTILVGEHSVKEAVQETDVPGLDFLACGPIPPNPSELLHTSQFHELVAETARLYDQVIFDSPPLTAVTDAAIIAPQVNGSIVVIHGQKTSRDALRSALRRLQSVRGHIVGGVLNDVDLAARSYGYSYYAKGGYYSEEPRDPGDGGGSGGDGEVPAGRRPVAQA